MTETRTATTICMVAAALLLGALSASAAPSHVSATMSVSAVVAANCRVTLTPLNFGSYDPLGVHASAALDATATMQITCTRGSHATILMDAGRAPLASSGLRGLVAADQVLGYQIFRDASRTEVWGEGADAMRFVWSNSSTTAQDVVVYGRIPPGQEVAAGTYGDVVTATVDF